MEIKVLAWERHLKVARLSKLIKKYLKLLNRLYDITWFGSVYA
jgi:hypothetical protein